jgi:PAS domain S-box-containing protein
VRRFRELIDCIPAVIYECETGPKGRWVYVSAQLQDLLGYRADEWMDDANAYVRCLHPEDRDAVIRMEPRELAAAGGGDVTAVSEYRMVRADGNVRWIRDEARLGMHDSGQPVWRGILLDVTKEHMAREALTEASARYGEALERVSASRKASAVGRGELDALRLECASCGTVWVGKRVEVCRNCGSTDVKGVSLAATLAELAAAEHQIELLLDGIREHLERLGTTLGPELASGLGRRVMTPLREDAERRQAS